MPEKIKQMKKTEPQTPPPKKWQSHIITAQPDMFPGPLAYSLAGRARDNKIWDFSTYNLYDFGLGTHHKIDDAPYGGGAGLVMRPDIAAAALDYVCTQATATAPDLPILMPSPRGVPFTQNDAKALAAGQGAIFFCTRFEGIDERFIENRPIKEVSLGDYILSGGEAATLIILDCIIRLLDGTMGKAESALYESFEGGLLEHPHYTKPALWEGGEVPETLRNGNHADIEQWRRTQAEAITRSRRPDLWRKYKPNDES